MNSITLPCFRHSEVCAQLEDLMFKSSLDMFKMEDITFYTINAISRFEKDGKNYTCVHSNGSEYISNYDFDKLKTILETK